MWGKRRPERLRHRYHLPEHDVIDQHKPLEVSLIFGLRSEMEFKLRGIFENISYLLMHLKIHSYCLFTLGILGGGTPLHILGTFGLEPITQRTFTIFPL